MAPRASHRFGSPGHGWPSTCFGSGVVFHASPDSAGEGWQRKGVHYFFERARKSGQLLSEPAPFTETMNSTPKSPAQMKSRPVWAEVSTSALVNNLNAIRKYVNPPGEKRKTPRKILAIVKGNGYGHGGPQVAKVLEKAGADWFGVTCTDEGIAVRKAGVRKPVLILTSFVHGEESRLIEHGLTAVIHRCEQLAMLDRAAAKRGRKRARPSV